MSNQADKIDRYLADEMRPDEAAEFERQVQMDPLLSEEVSMQRAVIDGIKEFRKSQLKARLSQIDVTGANYLWQSGFSKALVVASVGTVVLVSSWYLYSKVSSEAVVENFIDSGGPQTEKILSVEMPILPKAAEIEVETITPISDEYTAVQITEEEVETTSEVETHRIFDPQFSVPGEQSLVDTNEFSSQEAEAEVLLSTTIAKDEVLDVEHKDVKSRNLRYQYFEGKLSLFGNFGSDPYEILEINSAGGRQVYLYFAENYYHLLPTSKPEQLILVDDEKTVNQLQILRAEK